MAKTIQNGSFRDPLGNALDAGRLELFLSQEAHEKAGGQIAPTKVSITLDATGDVAGTLILANDELDPDGTFYRATAYDADGARVYGPVDWVLSGATPINLDDIIPTSVAVSAISPVPSTRLISTTAPLTGGGDLSIDRTHVLTGAPSVKGDIYTHDGTNATSLSVAASDDRMLLSAASASEGIAWIARRNRFATVAPGTGDDGTQGYSQTSLWVDITNDNAYICVDNTAAAAVWRKINDFSYALQANTSGSENPGDATTTYFGSAAIAINTPANRNIVMIPRAGNIVRVDLRIIVTGTLGTSETGNVWVRTNDTTDSLNMTPTWDAITGEFSATGSVAVSAGDFFEMKVTTPTFSANPLSVAYMATILIES